ncbi:hypothetical protein QNI19_14525 [Cytophagaceae bacterium DM2B3-1]|uniref:Uncharacterized protein n=1 Tax=Xanthocytophaga flava TaxID=3048013 RepID=A0ABT7CK86_9BACT|nr:hypothetical protein [Xanthocytophaga flavus]MDJ1494156.1 hypothetical protein [Xanthocytophaga flavus]
MNETILNPTPQQLEEWTKKYGKVNEFESADGKKCWLAKPSRDVIRAANVAGGDDSIKWNEVLLKNIFLAGDPCFITDDEYFFGLTKELGDLVPKKLVELKKTY